ncbi:isoprenylcysteine carboxylmethyltransferase family protein [Mycolicibacterium boenickei]|uniref:Isoprenylcysteine carboxylmethyltransferase family protein n=1 Tax=Mycolicibacterium boenickei TaxID=146017 RepID=A0AAX3A110_9MYCO|nr:isoprenylcysteine carboxylmethyltransferase family protein [Mycolicibacterium boenickei]PEG59873.1 isoprenylcysteine carboxylmethyltransferase family protein [Mycolicibacterium boenickei]UNC01357.1 isoprenylcysteine carboxylmethyltransferase family protein [Mycolicibacterium boenickei]BBX91230.1 membrane protein [Mycolicibacterium boenickei]
MKLALQTIASGVFGLALFAVALFWPAGTFHYWQAWVFVAVFMATTMVPSIYLAVRDPAALQRRLHGGPTAETRLVQKIVIWAVTGSAFAAFVLSALDHRFGWSSVPVAVVVLGNILVAVGLILAQAVVFQNSFAGASIQVEDEQPLVSTGLYGLVRHPMYFGAVLMMFGTPLALGSYWALLVSILAVPIFGVRIADEEKMLRAELAGYDEYTQKVRYRLLPYVW